jgi:hypothetical protein
VNNFLYTANKENYNGNLLDNSIHEDNISMQFNTMPRNLNKESKFNNIVKDEKFENSFVLTQESKPNAEEQIKNIIDIQDNDESNMSERIDDEGIQNIDQIENI